MKKPLSELSSDEFSTLKRMGFLYDFYPDAPDTYAELSKYNTVIKIFKKILASADSYDIIELKRLVKDWLNEYER